jgi:diacylglycerol O-acyltransferase
MAPSISTPRTARVGRRGAAVLPRRPGGAVENTAWIAASPQVVFDFMTDLGNEPRWNPQMSRVEKLTPGEIGRGTCFQVQFGHGVGDAMIEYTEFDHARSWSALSRSRLLDVDSVNHVSAVPGGSVLVIRTWLHPHGALRLAAPVLGRWMHRTWDRNLRAVKAQIETAPGAAVAAVSRTPTIRRVPVQDLCTLWAETRSTPMNMALIGVLENRDENAASEPDMTALLARVRAAVAANLPRVPMLRRVLHPTRLAEGGPIWVDAPSFDVTQHVVLARPEPPLTEASFHAWCAGRSLLPLDRSRPLWRMDIVPGLGGGRVGVLVVLHHVVADGLRGVEIISTLLDEEPQPQRDAVAPWRPEPAPSRQALIKDNLHRRVAAVGRMRHAHPLRSLHALRALAREPDGRAPATSLTGSIRPGRQLIVLAFDLRELRSVAGLHACTINELLLAGVTRGLRSLLQARGECPDGLVLRASVPVAARAGRPGGMVMAPLPVGVADPEARLRTIVETTRARKRHPDAGTAVIVTLPASVARVGVLWAKHAAAGHINLYVTNVPGPAAPLYLAGARLVSAVPLAPLVAGVRLSVTALSYDGRFVVSLLADDALDGLPLLAEGVRAALRDVTRPATAAPTGRPRS